MAAEIFGYRFADAGLLEAALTTPACKMDRPDIRDNQRLEFLGDAVLGLLAAERLYCEAGGCEEGALTVQRARLVSTASLARAAWRLGLADRLRRNRGAAPIREGSKTLADAMEAVLGAAWLDGGLKAAQTIFAALELTAAAGDENPKGELQIRAQAMVPPHHPVYELVKATGKAHEPVFTVRVSVEGVGAAAAEAGSLKAAEAAAAAKLLADWPTD